MTILDKFKNYGAQMVQQYPHSTTRCLVGLVALGAGVATSDVALIAAGAVYQGVNWLTATVNENHFNAANKVHKHYADDGAGLETMIEGGAILCNKTRQFIGTVAPAVGLYMMFQNNVAGTILFAGSMVAQAGYVALFNKRRTEETTYYKQEAQKLGL